LGARSLSLGYHFLANILYEEGISMSQRKAIIWAVAGCGLGMLVCLAVGVIFLGLGGGYVWWSIKEPEDVVVDIDIPVLVAKGEPFVIEVQIKNTAAQGQTLDSIDVSMDYLEGIVIEQVDPSFVESYIFSSDGTDWRSYTFRQDIAPDDTLVIRFESVGVSTGDYSGDIDICINLGSRCLTFPCRTIVED
jgi:hypothetical protein